jgi:hypothetical protein
MKINNSALATFIKELKKYGYYLYSTRETRYYVHAARMLGFPIAKKPKYGYFYARKWKEYEPTYLSERAHALSVLQAQNRVAKRFISEGSLSLSELNELNAGLDQSLKLMGGK